MIILDTNVVSEFMTSQPADSVLEWMNNQQSSQLYLTTITIAEITYPKFSEIEEIILK